MRPIKSFRTLGFYCCLRLRHSLKIKLNLGCFLRGQLIFPFVILAPFFPWVQEKGVAIGRHENILYLNRDIHLDLERDFLGERECDLLFDLSIDLSRDLN